MKTETFTHIVPDTTYIFDNVIGISDLKTIDGEVYINVIREVNNDKLRKD